MLAGGERLERGRGMRGDRGGDHDRLNRWIGERLLRIDGHPGHRCHPTRPIERRLVQIADPGKPESFALRQDAAEVRTPVPGAQQGDVDHFAAHPSRVIASKPDLSMDPALSWVNQPLRPASGTLVPIPGTHVLQAGNAAWHEVTARRIAGTDRPRDPPGIAPADAAVAVDPRMHQRAVLAGGPRMGIAFLVARPPGG